MEDKIVLDFFGGSTEHVRLSNALYARGIRTFGEVALSFERQWKTLVWEYGDAESVELRLVQHRPRLPDLPMPSPSLLVTITRPSQGVFAAFDRAKATGKLPAPRKPSHVTVNIHGGNNQLGRNNTQHHQ